MPEIFYCPVGRNGEIPWLDGVFLGWRQDRPPYQELLYTSHEDSVAIIGPPRSGKTGGLLIPAAMTWNGSLISASTKTDVLRATRGRRLDQAITRHGDVYLYAPSERGEATDGVKHLRWSPLAGCEDPSVCEERVAKIIGPRRQDQNEDEFFRQQALTVLRGYFHAAALGGLTMRRVKRWVDENSVQEPINILKSKAETVSSAEAYLSSLRGIEKQAPETKSSTFSTVSGKLGPLVNNAVVLENLERPNFDIDRFLATGSTMYIVSPENVQEVIAPLITGLIEAIVTRAYALASRQRNGRLDPPLLLLLDEVGAIAPLPTLPAIMGQGASQGILCAWAAQTFNQLKAKWGDDWATSILGASSHKIIFGGAAADTDLLTQMSELFGEWDRWVSPFGIGRKAQAKHVLAVLGKNPQNPVHSKEKVLTVNDLFQKPKGQATVIADTPAGPQFASVGVPHAATVSPFREALHTESAIQQQLTGHEHEPAHLKSSATITRVFAELPPGERQRFEKEQHRLLGQIRELEGLAGPARDARLRKDPGLSRELASWRTIAARSRADRMQSELEIVFAFASGEIPHFTYTVIPAPELELPQGPLKEPRQELPGEPRPPEQQPPEKRPIQRAQTWTESR